MLSRRFVVGVFPCQRKGDDKDEAAAAAEIVLGGRGYCNKLQAFKMQKIHK